MSKVSSGRSLLRDFNPISVMLIMGGCPRKETP